MRKVLLISAILFGAIAQSYAYDADNQSYKRWRDDKFSMFVHFGLYSHLGGVWDGEPVRSGYSEQIQSFAGIFSDWYGAVAREFNPESFDAADIARLAEEAGMRSIVFTSKHHDGFCMFDTATTSYNSVDATPASRDYVREMSEACAEAGIRFGLYFSLIDWHYPYAYPISSHNADFVTEQHHQLNKAQVRELLTSYGPVSELWFDMGSLSPEQSRELYDLVKELQPNCLVSGRLGNDVYDFAVMADNRLPDQQLHAPWQSAASMFPETWSWRSWQQRGEVPVKVAEKIRSLTDVVAGGGNYLLNIGPQADGSVVPFEREVLLAMGQWLDANGDAVYETSPSPFRRRSDWGVVTVKDRCMYLILNGKYPDDGKIALQMPGYSLITCHTDGVGVSGSAPELILEVPESFYGRPDSPEVIRLEFDRPVRPFGAENVVASGETLSWENSTPDYSYSCFDYYSNYRSTVAYNWLVGGKKKVRKVELLYTSDEVGRKIVLEVGQRRMCVELSEEVADLSFQSVPGEVRRSRLRGGVFDGPQSWDNFDWSLPEAVPVEDQAIASHPFTNYVAVADVEMRKEGYALLNVVSGNGVEVIVNGRTMMKHLNAYRSCRNEENVLLYLPKGVSRVAVRSYNRFEDTAFCALEDASGRSLYRTCIELPEAVWADGLRLKLSADDIGSEHRDCRLHNIRINLK